MITPVAILRGVPARVALAGSVTVSLLLLPPAASPNPAAAQTDCPAGWSLQPSADRRLSLCLPAGFVRREAHTWMRPGNIPGAPPVDFFSVEVIRWPANSASVGSWPPRLATPGCQVECIRVDSAVTHADEWSGHSARTEVGLASGGAAGLTRRPVMVSGWILADGQRGFAQGWAARAITLDTLRQVLRTVKRIP